MGAARSTVSGRVWNFQRQRLPAFHHQLVAMVPRIWTRPCVAVGWRCWGAADALSRYSRGAFSNGRVLGRAGVRGRGLCRSWLNRSKGVVIEDQRRYGRFFSLFFKSEVIHYQSKGRRTFRHFEKIVLIWILGGICGRFSFFAFAFGNINCWRSLERKCLTVENR